MHLSNGLVFLFTFGNFRFKDKSVRIIVMILMDSKQKYLECPSIVNCFAIHKCNQMDKYKSKFKWRPYSNAKSIDMLKNNTT